MINNYGAQPGDWAHWSFVLGLTTDLLPVVSNPNSIISETSKLQGIGKTPSTYIGSASAKRVIGLPGWTAKRTIDEEVEQWSEDTDLGICLQTREVRAIDVDVTDAYQASEIALAIESFLKKLPKRQRSNSAKYAYAVRIEGELPKRKLITEHGMIEFLATGQQFVVSGTHPTGARYEWRDGLPLDIPTITIEEFNACWRALEQQFATEPSAEGREFSSRRSGETIDADDTVRDYLVATKRVISTDRDGVLTIKCPWHDQHTSGSVGDSSTVWFTAGTKGYERGHYRCLHGHCENRTDDEFIEAIGMPTFRIIDMFEVLPQRFVMSADGSPTGVLEREPPRFEGHTHDGQIKPTLNNILLALERPDYAGIDIKFDEFKSVVMIKLNRAERRAFGDNDYAEIRLMLERKRFAPISKEMIKDVISMVADRNKYDSAMDWINSLVWDGVPRIELFNHTHLGADNTLYTRAVSMYTWTAFAGRCLVPGIKADMAPILQSRIQGRRKSAAIEALAPTMDEFLSVTFKDSEADIARKMRGKLVIEVAEMDGLKMRESESTKALMSNRGAEIVPKFKEISVVILRRGLFMMTTNENEILHDPSGARRYLPFKIRRANVTKIREDLLQLWAEARVVFNAQGIAWQNAEFYAKPEHDKFRAIDPWEEIIHDWLYTNDSMSGKLPVEDIKLTTTKIMTRAIGILPGQMTKNNRTRVIDAMNALGFSNNRIQKDNDRDFFWRKGPSEDDQDDDLD